MRWPPAPLTPDTAEQGGRLSGRWLSPGRQEPRTPRAPPNLRTGHEVHRMHASGRGPDNDTEPGEAFAMRRSGVRIPSAPPCDVSRHRHSPNPSGVRVRVGVVGAPAADGPGVELSPERENPCGVVVVDTRDGQSHRRNGPADEVRQDGGVDTRGCRCEPLWGFGSVEADQGVEVHHAAQLVLGDLGRATLLGVRRARGRGFYGVTADCSSPDCWLRRRASASRTCDLTVPTEMPRAAAVSASVRSSK
jgi:hypothetical protein